MKKWEADIQRALESREKKTLTVLDLEDARTFAGKPDKMLEEPGKTLRKEAIGQVLSMGPSQC